MKKQWVASLCALALALCVAVSGAWAQEKGVSQPAGAYSSHQALVNSFSMAGNALVVEEEGGYSLKDAQGRALVPAGVYSSMYIPSDMEDWALIAVAREEGQAVGWGVIDAQGRELVPPVYDAVRGYSQKWQAGIRAQATDGDDFDFRSGGVRYRVTGADLYFEGAKAASMDARLFSYDARAYGDYLYFAHAVLSAQGQVLDYSSDHAYSMDQEYADRMGMVLHFGSGGEAFSPFSVLTAQEVDKPLWHMDGPYFRVLRGNLITCEKDLVD